jgi:alkylation response protein AidB-like acyl-CoA dehydrogenase
MGEQTAVLVVDEIGCWGVAHVRLTQVRSLGVRAAGLTGCAFEGWVERGRVPPEKAMHARAIMRLWGAAILAGLSRGALAHTMEYVQERSAFGKPLAHHQGLAFIVADMATRAEGMSLLVARSAWAMEGGEGSEGTDAWLEAVESSLWITNHAVQLLGGHGYTQDHPVEKWMRDARAIGLLWGGVDLAQRDAQRRVGV